MELNDKYVRSLIRYSITFGVGIFIFISIIYFLKGNVNYKYDIDSELVSSFGIIIAGIIGTFFTIIATLLIWFTYQSQKQELIKTTEIAYEQSKTSKKQNETLNLQKFENTFFNMSATLMNIPDKLYGALPKISYKPDGSNEILGSIILSSGKEYFNKTLKILKSKFSDKFDWKAIDDKTLEENTARIYNEFYDTWISGLDHYFRYLYNILKFIDNSEIDFKKHYIDLLQAQLSNVELGLIFYNGIGRYGKTKLYPLLEKYNFLENLNDSAIFMKNHTQIRLYPYTTFKFLDNDIKEIIILKAMVDNPDNVKNYERLYYYFNKYNLTKIEVEYFTEKHKKVLKDNRLISKVPNML